MNYRIMVKTLNNNLLMFRHVDVYKIVDGYVTFLDSKTGEYKMFAVSNTEIEREVDTQ